MKFRLPLIVVGAMTAAISGLQAAPDQTPSTSISIKGAVEHPATLTSSDLQGQPATTENVFFHTNHGPIVCSYTVFLLWSLLQTAGVKLDAAAKNDIVRHVVVITGTDGYSAILALGELDPELSGQQVIVAYQADGKPIEPSHGFARLIVPGDKAAARDVERIVSIEVK